jgi:hypothetical protein
MAGVPGGANPPATPADGTDDRSVAVYAMATTASTATRPKAQRSRRRDGAALDDAGAAGVADARGGFGDALLATPTPAG